MYRLAVGGPVQCLADDDGGAVDLIRTERGEARIACALAWHQQLADVVAGGAAQQTDGDGGGGAARGRRQRRHVVERGRDGVVHGVVEQVDRRRVQLLDCRRRGLVVRVRLGRALRHYS